MNERDNAMLNANIHEYYMDVTLSLTGACMYQTFMNVCMFGHININDMLSGSGTDAHIHEREARVD